MVASECGIGVCVLGIGGPMSLRTQHILELEAGPGTLQPVVAGKLAAELRIK